jgi:flagellin
VGPLASQVIRTNVSSLNAWRNLKGVGIAQRRASNRLASGFRINSAADDAAGLAISEKIRGQIRSMDQAGRNTMDGISLIQTAEGALSSITDMIIRIRELTIQGANDTNTQEDRNKIAAEVFQLSTEIRETEERVEFNTIRLFNTVDDGNNLNGTMLMVGANMDQMIKIDLDLDFIVTPYNLTDDAGTTQRVSFLTAMSSMLNHAGLALQGAHGNNEILMNSYNYSGDDTLNAGLMGITNNGITGRTQTLWISRMIQNIDFVLSNISGVRAKLGAVQNRLDFTKQNLDVSSENLNSANSRIRDADMSREMMRFTQSNVLQQAAVAMLAQANQAPQNILSLLR